VTRAGSLTTHPAEEPEDDREVRDALDRLGLRTLRLALLSAADPMKRGRSTHRADLEDGSSIKARRLESAEEARRLLELRVGPADRFVRPIAHRGRVLVEPWIEGTGLGAQEAAARAREAGALLGSLHASAFSTPPTRIPTRPWCELAREEIGILGSAGRLSAGEVDNLEDLIHREDPGSSRAALVHCDFRPDNLLVDPRGRLRVVDNEWLRIDPADWDLARTFSLWPMSEPVREQFLTGYRTTAQDDPGSRGFWEVAAALWTLRIRRDDSPARLEGPLALLRRFGRAGAA
jgi:hypothetical protein